MWFNFDWLFRQVPVSQPLSLIHSRWIGPHKAPLRSVLALCWLWWVFSSIHVRSLFVWIFEGCHSLKDKIWMSSWGRPPSFLKWDTDNICFQRWLLGRHLKAGIKSGKILFSLLLFILEGQKEILQPLKRPRQSDGSGLR